MADEILRDNRGMTIARISTDWNGILTIRDEKGVKKGTYNPKENKTRNIKGLTVGSGNLLTTLL